jgi:hypothetical protein
VRRSLATFKSIILGYDTKNGGRRMFVIIVVALILGIWRFRSAEYFKWVGMAFLWMLAGTFLFSGGGTLEDPTGDGLIAHQVRIGTNDGPMMGLYAIVMIVVLWGGIIYFLNRARKAANAFKEARAALDDQGVFEQEEADTSRKGLETVGLLILAGAWFYFNFSTLMAARNAPEQSADATASAEPSSPTPLTVEQEVLGAAAQINAEAPHQIDLETVLERASASGRTLTYHYSLKGEGGADGDRLRKFALANVVPKVCISDLRESMKDRGVSYIYSYAAKGLDHPVSVTVSEEICSNLET